jgi:hypothetical protein
MNIRHTALFLATAVGAALGVALVVGPTAHADAPTFPTLPVTIDDFQTWPPSEGFLTSQKTITSVPGYSDTQDTFHYQNYDDANNIIGQYDGSWDTQTYNPTSWFPYGISTFVVTDSAGAGLPVGTTWDSDSFNIAFPYPYSIFFPGFPLYESYSIGMPDGMTAQLTEFLNIGNDYVTGPGGTAADYLYVFGDFIPLFDTLSG